ncbi:MAG: hypothetical protein ABI638_01635 [Ignavibacteriota bacterium]
MSSVLRTTALAGSWYTVNSGLTNTYVTVLGVSGINIFAGTYGGGIFRSTNDGDS